MTISPRNDKWEDDFLIVVVQFFLSCDFGGAGFPGRILVGTVVVQQVSWFHK